MASQLYTLHKTSPYPLGASYTDKGVRFSVEIGVHTDCGVLIYPHNTSAPVKVPFPSWARAGRICSFELRPIGAKNSQELFSDGSGKGLKYLYYKDNEIFLDPYMQDSSGFGAFGDVTSPFSVVNVDENNVRSGFVPKPYSESIFYMLHVRGYTAHPSSGVKNKGTFRGVIQKLSYIKSLGVTGIIFMPVYEFNELMYAPEMIRKEGEKPGMVNFWGYTGGYYYVPKHAYSASGNPVKEMHEMIDAVHDAGMEVILQFRFVSGMSVRQVGDILRFWRDRYGVDGFQIIGTDLAIDEIMIDPVLYGCKILFDDALTRTDEKYNPEHGFMNIGYMSGIRKFLKGDPNSAPDAAFLIKNCDPVTHPVVFIARQDSMRAFDIVSYNEKHNEENGENGRDGADFNFSWNCGIEGPTRKKAIMDLRKKQLKNAFALLLMSQGTPLIYGGDEFANTQYGNNNPYNQDNATGYVKWTKSAFGQEILELVRSLIKIRSEHASIGSDHALSGRDYLSYGYPDVSMHGEELWRADIGPTSHSFGILYYDKYSDPEADKLIYIIYNMHWETKNIAVPKLKGHRKWELTLTSDEDNKYDHTSVISVVPRSFIILETYVR